MPDKELFYKLEEKEGYMIFYTAEKGIQVRKGSFDVHKSKKFGYIITQFYYENSDKNKNADMYTHYHMHNMKAVEPNRLYVERKEDIEEGILILKEYLKDKIIKLTKEYEDRKANFERAIESEVIYEC